MSRKVLAASLAGCVGIWLCVFLPGARKPVYAHGVQRFLSLDLRDEEVRVEGELVVGSLCSVPNGSGYRFAITDTVRGTEGNDNSPAVLAVHYEGSSTLPDTLRDVPGYPIRLTVQGERCRTCREFQATLAMAKCSGKYEIRSYAEAGVRPTPIPVCDVGERPRL